MLPLPSPSPQPGGSYSCDPTSHEKRRGTERRKRGAGVGFWVWLRCLPSALPSPATQDTRRWPDLKLLSDPIRPRGKASEDSGPHPVPTCRPRPVLKPLSSRIIKSSHCSPNQSQIPRTHRLPTLVSVQLSAASDHSHLGPPRFISGHGRLGQWPRKQVLPLQLTRFKSQLHRFLAV